MNFKDTNRFFKKVRKTIDGCWYWIGASSRQYGHFKYRRKTIKAHRFSFVLFIGYLEDDIQVMHKCDNRKCVNPFHLIKGSNLQNMADKVSKGRQLIGEDHGRAKLTEAHVIQILSDKTLTYNQLAEIYKVDRRHISNIKRGKCWTHLKISNDGI